MIKWYAKFASYTYGIAEVQCCKYLQVLNIQHASTSRVILGAHTFVSYVYTRDENNSKSST